MILFTTDTKVRLSSFRGERYGKTWEADEFKELTRLFSNGEKLSRICTILQRPAVGVLAKLKCFLTYNAETGEYFREMPTAQLAQTTQPTKEDTTMNAKIIETVVMIQGTDATHKSDDEIFKLISNLEMQADVLLRIQAKPKKLALKIDAIHADIKKLVEYVDGRE